MKKKPMGVAISVKRDTSLINSCAVSPPKRLTYSVLRMAGLRPMKPGEHRRVRIQIHDEEAR